MSAKKTKTSASWWQRSWKNAVINKKLCYWVWTEISTLASLTEFTHPYFIELVHGLFYDFWVICKDASFKVSFIIRFHTNTGTSKVCTTDIYFFSIKGKHLEMNARTKNSFQAVREHRIYVEVLPKVRTRFLSMN